MLWLLLVSINRIFILAVILVWQQGILNLELGVSYCLEPVVLVDLVSKLPLSIECTELGFILHEVILTVLKHSLVVEVAHRPALALWLCILVSIFHFLVSHLHMA